MKKYLAIGHFKDGKSMTSVTMKNNTKKDFQADLKGNEFVAYVVITEKKFETLKNLDRFDLFCKVKKMTTNYRVWNEVVDYIEQCFDIIESRMSMAE